MKNLILFFALSATTANATLGLPPMIPDYQLILGLYGCGGWCDGDQYSTERNYYYDSTYYGAGGFNAAFYAERFAIHAKYSMGRSADNNIREMYTAGSIIGSGLKYHSFASLGMGTVSGMITRNDSRRGTNSPSYFGEIIAGLLYRPDGGFIIRFGIGYRGIPAGRYSNFFVWLGESQIKVSDMFGLNFRTTGNHSWQHYRHKPPYNRFEIAAGFDIYFVE